MDLSSAVRDITEVIISIFNNIPIIRQLVGILLTLLLPGFAWTLILFHGITHLERLVLSFGISMAFTTLSILFSNVIFGIKITGLNAVVTILLITLIPLIIFLYKRYLNNKRTDN